VTKSCTWCKITLVVVVTLVVTAIVGLTVTSGGAAGSAIVGAVKAAGYTLGAAAGAAIAKTLITLISAGVTYLLGDFLCCKLFGVDACCIKESVEFWTELSRRLEASGGGSLSEDDCAAMKKIIDKLVAEKKIDDSTAQTLRDELKQHCPQ